VMVFDETLGWKEPGRGNAGELCADRRVPARKPSGAYAPAELRSCRDTYLKTSREIPELLGISAGAAALETKASQTSFRCQLADVQLSMAGSAQPAGQLGDRAGCRLLQRGRIVSKAEVEEQVKGCSPLRELQ